MTSKEKRISFLEKSMAEKPEDSFFKYALAMELQEDNPMRAIELLKEVIDTQPDYLPSYYSLGKLLSEQSHYENALSILEKGLELSKNLKDGKTQSEISTLIQNIEFEMD